jgi:hypothetical protein
MSRYKYFTKDEDNNMVEVSEDISNDVIRQYIERRYTGAIILAVFVIGFLCGVIASA